MKREELIEYKADENFGNGLVYSIPEVNQVLDEKDAEIAALKKKLMPCLNGDCILTCDTVEKYSKENAALKMRIEDLENLNHDLCERVIENDEIRLHWEEIEQVKAENEQVKKACRTLRKKLEDVQATAYTDSVDAGMRERRLKRALWLARAELCHRLDVDRYLRNHRNSWYNENYLTWNEACVAMEVKMCKAESKCQAKAEEYK